MVEFPERKEKTVKGSVWIDTQGGWTTSQPHEVKVSNWTEADWRVFRMMSPEIRYEFSAWVRNGSWYRSWATYASPERFVNEVVLTK